MSEVWIVLIGVSAGWVLAVCTPAATRWLTRKRRRRALALLVCPLLEQFMLACQAVIDDEGERRQGNRQAKPPQVCEGSMIEECMATGGFQTTKTWPARAKLTCPKHRSALSMCWAV